MANRIEVKGLREFLVTLRKCDKETQKLVRDRLRKAAESVKRDSAIKIGRYNVRTAAGYRVIVRTRGVSVEQRLRKTTGQHPEWGSFQMERALIPSLNENVDEIQKEIDLALRDIAEIFNG